MNESRRYFCRVQESLRRCPVGRLKTNTERNARNVKDLLKDYWATMESAKDSENQQFARGKRLDERKRSGARHDD